MCNTMTFSATGDSLITRRLPVKDKEFLKIASIINSAEVRFTNLEATVHHSEGYPSAISGGTWIMAQPSVLQDLKDYGFNMIAWANNHTMDYTYGGLIATEKNLNKFGFVHAGAGQNLASASGPRYLEAPSGRVALIAATSNFDRTWIAGAQRPDMFGRPGINPLRSQLIYTVSPERIKQLKSIAEATNVNAAYNVLTNKGFMKKHANGSFPFGDMIFQEGSEEGEITKPHEKDMARILKSISEAKGQADYIIVSIHSHQPKGESMEVPADFLVTFARKCIDEGAHSVIGHGPHILRGIEVYKGRPIFYSLGNFIFQDETVTTLPSDFYDRVGLGHDNNITDAFNTQSLNDTSGFGVYPEAWQSIIPFWRMKDGVLTELSLHPIELGYGMKRHRRGWPKISEAEEIINNLKELSKPFGVTIKIENGVGKIIL
ncbi:MAG: CapA family protein [Paenibacillaceae bacterium]